jgi:hypothetical protein
MRYLTSTGPCWKCASAKLLRNLLKFSLIAPSTFHAVQRAVQEGPAKARSSRYAPLSQLFPRMPPSKNVCYVLSVYERVDPSERARFSDGKWNSTYGKWNFTCLKWNPTYPRWVRTDYVLVRHSSGSKYDSASERYSYYEVSRVHVFSKFRRCGRTFQLRRLLGINRIARKSFYPCMTLVHSPQDTNAHISTNCPFEPSICFGVRRRYFCHMPMIGLPSRHGLSETMGVVRRIHDFFENLQLPSRTEYRQAWCNVVRDVWMAAHSVHALSCLALRPFMLLLWLVSQKVYICLKFLFRQLFQGVWVSLWKGLEQATWCSKKLVAWQYSLTSTQSKMEVGAIVVLLLLFSLRRYLQKQGYIQRVSRWYQIKKRIAIKVRSVQLRYTWRWSL